MAEILIKTVFQLKRGLAEAWTRVNPLLQTGEPGFEIDTGKLKIGNGIDNWNNLSYLVGEDEGALHFKGSVQTAAELPIIAEVGDIYQVISENTLYVLNSSKNWEVFHAIDFKETKEYEIEGYNALIDKHEIRMRQDSFIDSIVLDIYPNDIAAKSYIYSINSSLDKTRTPFLFADKARIGLTPEDFNNNVCTIVYEFYNETGDLVKGSYVTILLCTEESIYDVEPFYMKNYLKKDSINNIDGGDADDWV